MHLGLYQVEGSSQLTFVHYHDQFGWLNARKTRLGMIAMIATSTVMGASFTPQSNNVPKTICGKQQQPTNTMRRRLR
jgi:hypothetical protein